jgi:hypothetical protein
MTTRTDYDFCSYLLEIRSAPIWASIPRFDTSASKFIGVFVASLHSKFRNDIAPRDAILELMIFSMEEAADGLADDDITTCMGTEFTAGHLREIAKRVSNL